MSRLRTITIACYTLLIGASSLCAEVFGSLEDQMVVAFSLCDYGKAKRLAQQIKDASVEGEEHRNQCLSVLADVPPEDRWAKYWDEEDLPKGWWEMDDKQQHRFLIDSQKQRLPQGFATWKTDRKIKHLIRKLNETWADQSGYPGGVDLTEDIFVWELIEIGDPAVPALIDVIDQDQRLTRATHFWRGGVGGTILSVKEAALTAVMSIIQIEVFESGSTGDNLTARGDATAKRIAKELRDYWERYGRLPFDERMMKQLTDASLAPEMRCAAAWNLADLGGRQTYSTTVWTARSEPPPDRPNPAIAKFSDPTAAEAILAAMDAHLAQSDRGGGHSELGERRRIASSYLDTLYNLGDKRITPELGRRFRGDGSWFMRHNYADLAAHLGDLHPLHELCDRVTVPQVGVPALDVLSSLLQILAARDPDRADKIILAATDQSHPLHTPLMEALLDEDPHPATLVPAAPRYLRAMLDYKGERRDGLAWNDQEIHQRAASVLDQLVFGFPKCPADGAASADRLDQAKAWLDEMLAGPGLRRTTDSEFEAATLDVFPWEARGGVYRLIPNVSPLARPATADDVAQRKAAFAIAGSQVIAMELPAYFDRPKLNSAVIVFQAERDAGGEVFYGGIDSDRGWVKLRHGELEAGSANGDPHKIE